MTPEDREKVNQLARLIHGERDPSKFNALAEELCELLDRVLPKNNGDTLYPQARRYA